MSFHAKMSLDDGWNDLVVLSASYCYTQPLDAQNLPNNKSKISVLNVTIASSKDNKIIEWMVSPTMTKAVKITFYDGNGATLKTLEMTDTYCVGFKEIFNANDTNPMKIMLRLAGLGGKSGADTLKNDVEISSFLPDKVPDHSPATLSTADVSSSAMDVTSPSNPPRCFIPPEKLSDFGERIIEENLEKQGYIILDSMRNGSDHGIDIIAIQSVTGNIKVIEVKSTQQDRLWNNGKMNVISLRGDQKNMGGEKYMYNRLLRAANGEDSFNSNSSDAAITALLTISETQDNGKIIEFEKHDVYVDKSGNLLNSKDHTWP